MARKPGGRSTESFRAIALERLRTCTRVGELCKELGIHHKTLRRWQMQEAGYERSRVVEAARVALADIVKRGEKSGILRRGIDAEIAIVLLLGPMIYRHVFVTKTGGKAPKDLEVHVADAFLAAFTRRS
jgi:hypothetical protein